MKKKTQTTCGKYDRNRESVHWEHSVEDLTWSTCVYLGAGHKDECNHRNFLDARMEFMKWSAEDAYHRMQRMQETEESRMKFLPLILTGFMDCCC